MEGLMKIEREKLEQIRKEGPRKKNQPPIVVELPAAHLAEYQEITKKIVFHTLEDKFYQR